MQPATVSLLIVAFAGLCAFVSADAQTDCAQIISSASHMTNEEKQTLCRLYQSSTALTQLGAIVTDSLERFMATQALAAEQPAEGKHLLMNKRKHEYLRFGRK